jgi:hypothetical protein
MEIIVTFKNIEIEGTNRSDHHRNSNRSRSTSTRMAVHATSTMLLHAFSGNSQLTIGPSINTRSGACGCTSKLAGRVKETIQFL